MVFNPNFKPNAPGSTGAMLSKLKPGELGLLPRTTASGAIYLNSPLFSGGKLLVGWSSTKAFTDFIAGMGGSVFTPPGWKLEEGAMGFIFNQQFAISLPQRASELVEELRVGGGADYSHAPPAMGIGHMGLVMPIPNYTGIPYAQLFSRPAEGQPLWDTKNYLRPR